MNLKLKNIGIIKKANIKLNSITLIAGDENGYLKEQESLEIFLKNCQFQ